MLEVIDTNGCRNSAIFVLYLDTFPEINLGNDTTLCLNYKLVFNGNTSGQYLWQDGSSSNSFTVNEAGIYYVSISNTCGIDYDTCEVFYEDCRQQIWVPNAFTPNNDGLNDVFKPYIENVSTYHLYILNRWGELLFETTDFSQGWNGFYKDHLVPSDSYIWRIDYTNFDGKEFHKYGFVILYR